MQTHISITDEAELPPDVTLAKLRALLRDRQAQARALYPCAEAISLTLVFECDSEQRFAVSELPNFVPAHRMANPQRLDYGQVERFKFQWKHTNGEAV